MTDANWACARCEQATTRLSRAPWPGEEGRRVQQEICEACWREWLGVQTKIINEYRLNVLEPEHSKVLKEQMLVFFGLQGQEA